jgi:hypothetical protein
MLKKSVGLCVGLTMIISGSIAAAHDGGGGGTREIKSEASGTFVSANFDFDHPDLSTPANQIEAEGRGSIGRFTNHGVNEFTLDLNTKTCTVPGGVAAAGTALTLIEDVGVTRIKATGDFLFFKSTSGTACQDFSTFPTPPFPFTFTETGAITGGTGKFSGATGTFTADGQGATLSVDATGVRIFGWFENNVVTTLTTK